MRSRIAPDYTISMLDLLRYAFRLYRRNFTTLVGMAAAIEIPLVVMNLLAARRFFDPFGASALPPRGLPNLLLMAGELSLVPALLAGLGGGLLVVCNAAIAIAVTQQHSRRLSISQAYGRALDYPGSLLMLGLVFTLLVFAFSFAIGVASMLLALAESSLDDNLPAQAPFISGTIFVIAGSIYLLLNLRWLLAPQALVLGKHEGWSSLGHSWQLTGRSWLWLGAIWLSFEAVIYLIGWIDQWLMLLLSNTITLWLDLSPNVVMPFVDAVLICQVIPFYSILYTLLFLKLQPRLSESRFPSVLAELAAE